MKTYNPTRKLSAQASRIRLLRHKLKMADLVIFGLMDMDCANCGKRVGDGMSFLVRRRIEVFEKVKR